VAVEFNYPTSNKNTYTKPSTGASILNFLKGLIGLINPENAKTSYTFAVCCIVLALLSACSISPQDEGVATTLAFSPSDDTRFSNEVMNVAPFLPPNQVKRHEQCNVKTADKGFKTSHEVNYTKYRWEKRIAHQTEFFDIPQQEGRILIIDFAKAEDALAYRYLSNDNSHNTLYEPWSSSKIFAFTGAIAKLRDQGFGARTQIGSTYVADMITSINTYEAFGTSIDNSNALATLFANIAGRDNLSALFYDDWLKLSTPNIYFRGAYGPSAYKPNSYEAQMLDGTSSIRLQPYLNAADDPGYLNYRCESCGLTGNKPMTTLAQAEFLKRLASHTRDPLTQHPALEAVDVITLFYGDGNSLGNERFAGMSAGISVMLQHAIANSIQTETSTNKSAKLILDEASQGKWRVFQKIGWGPSDTRGTTEVVVLAHVCLPYYLGGREFTVSAQVSVPDADESLLPAAGKKMQRLLEISMNKLL